MKTKIIITFAMLLSFFVAGKYIFASTTDGTIDPNYRYAWGENIGFIDFGSSAGDVHITNTSISGFAYGENIGWINLSAISNEGGQLSGYAWGENTGFIDFSNIIIGTDGIFSGSAYGENIGWINFGTENNKVVTDWRPSSSLPSVFSHKNGGGFLVKTPVPILVSDDLNSVLCPQGHLFDTKTGSPCLNTPLKTESFLLNRNLKIMSPRMTGLDIRDLQVFLNSNGYSVPEELTVDGVFGTKTRQAIILFQKNNNLKQDGIVGPLTKDKLIINRVNL